MPNMGWRLFIGIRPKARIQLFGSALTIGRRYACELDQNRNDQAGPCIERIRMDCAF